MTNHQRTVRGASAAAAILGALLFQLAILPGSARASIKRVWAVDDTEKIKREDMSNALATSPDNAVWDGTTIRLFGGRNEVVAFQLIIEAGTSGSSSVNVTLASLTGNGYAIQNSGNAADPFDYRGKRIELFTEHYWNITQPSLVTKWWYNENAPAAYYSSGNLPVSLIPFQATAGRGGAPFAIAANTNQAVWVDVYVPKDAPAGTYTGEVVVSDGGTVVRRIPVALQVYGFTLPDETHFHNFFWLNAGELTSRFPVSSGSDAYKQVEGRFQQMAHRHRMDLSINATLDVIKSYAGRYMTGAFYTAANNYDGPGAGVGNGTYAIGVYDQHQDDPTVTSGKASGFVPDTQAGWRAASDAWVTWFSQNAPDTEIFKYMRDEPQGAASSYPQIWQTIRDRCTWIMTNPGPGRVLRRFCTTGIGNTELDGYINFWTTPHSYSLTEAARQKAKGAKVGVYNGKRPQFGVGTAAYDVEAVDARVVPWVAWRYGVDQYFMWYANRYDGKNVFKFIDPDLAVHSCGHGLVILPGRDKAYPTEDRGLDGPIASFLMKDWRRGQQDFEYLWLAKQAGHGAEADQIAAAIVPRALGDVTDHQPATWPMRGNAFERYRRQLAELLAGAPAPTGSFTVSPGGGLVSAGVTGGPFSPASIAYTLKNGGSRAISWTAAKTQSWVTLSAASGSLAAGASTTVTVGLGAGANALAAGSYADTVTFADTTDAIRAARAVQLTVSPAASTAGLALSPAGGLVTSGLRGGPFSPANITYTLKNSGTTTVAWSVSKTKSWLAFRINGGISVSSASGSLAPGASVKILVRVTSAANTLARGTYADTVTFKNTTNGTGTTTRPVSLTVR